MAWNARSDDAVWPAASPADPAPLEPSELVRDGLIEPIANWLARYVPRKARRARWPVVRPFVVSCMVALAPTTRPTAEGFLWALGGIAVWGLEQGLDLDPEVLLTPDMVEIYCSTVVSARSRITARSKLRQVGPLLTRRAPWPPAAEAMRSAGINAPYSARELAALRIDVSRQSTPDRRRACRTVLSLGGGAGLDGRWNMDVRGPDVHVADGVVLVAVGQPTPRVVPVLATFEQEVLELAELAGDDFLVGGKARSKNKASRAIARFESGPGRPRLAAPRLRSTWLLTHIEMNTRLPELAAAAGFTNISSLDELLPLSPLLDDKQRNRMLRGPL